MYCPKCGTLNDEGAKLCQSCGWGLSNNGSSTVDGNIQAKTSGAAKAALILAIIGFFTAGITVLPALICGIIALVNIGKSNGSLKGRGYAIFGIVAPLVFIIILLVAVLMPALFKVRPLAQKLICGENIKEIGTGLMMYANDYDGKLPDGDNWCNLLEQTVYVRPKVFICPTADGEDCSYAMNANVVGRDFDSLPADMVLVFESSPGCNKAGGPELLNIENHRNGCNILFCDGQVEFVKSDNFQWLVWDVPMTGQSQDTEN